VSGGNDWKPEDGQMKSTDVGDYFPEGQYFLDINQHRLRLFCETFNLTNHHFVPKYIRVQILTKRSRPTCSRME